jgi:hypothetical protein
MNEHDLGTALRTAVLDEPPLDFEPDRLVTRANRAAKHRRVMWLAGGAVAVLVLIVVAIPALSRPGPPAGHGDTLTVAKTDSSPTPPMLEFAHALQGRLNTAVPGAKVDPTQTKALIGFGTPGNPPAGVVAYTSGSTPTKGSRLVFRADAAGTPKLTLDTFCVVALGNYCHDMRPRPDGGVSFDTGYAMADLRADGSLLEVSCFDNATGDRGCADVEVLRALVTDPGLTLKAG